MQEAEVEVQVHYLTNSINFHNHILKVLMGDQKGQSARFVVKQVIQLLTATTEWIMPTKANIHPQNWLLWLHLPTP